MAFVFCGSFYKCAKRGRKNEQTKPTFEVAYLGDILEAISLKFGMWSTDVGRRVHSKNCLVQKGCTELQRWENFIFLSIYSQ